MLSHREDAEHGYDLKELHVPTLLLRYGSPGVPDHVDKILVNAPIFGEFGVKSGGQEVSLADKDGKAFTLRQHLDIDAGFCDARRANVDRF